MTAETAMRKIHRLVMDRMAEHAKRAEAIESADPDELRRTDEETADENESFVSDVEDIAVQWKESENRKAKKDKKGKRK